MKISESQFINTNTNDALDAAERWMRKEAPDLSPERGVTPDGLQYVGLDQLIDGIEIITRFVAVESSGGSQLTFSLRMQGKSFLGKIRNLGMLPAKKYVRSASREQFKQIIDELENPTGGYE